MLVFINIDELCQLILYGRITCKRLWIHVSMIECEWIDDEWVLIWWMS